MFSITLQFIAIGAILIALTFGRNKHTIYRYSMILCIATDLILLVYYYLQDGLSVCVIMVIAMILAATGALVIGEKLEKYKRG